MLRSFSQIMSIFCFTLSFAGLLSAPANAQDSKQDCAFEVILKSSPGAAVALSFRNASAENRRLYWLDANGNRKFITDVAPGTELLQPTSAGASWVATDNADKCLHAATATQVAETIDIGDVQTADVTQPVSDAVPQSLAQVPSDAPSPGVAAPISQTRALPDPSDGADAAASQGEDTGAVPQISPIEQFQLSGAYHITPRVDSAKMLNGPVSGTVDVSPLKPAWDGGRWAFEAVSGTPFVRIKNTWKNTYLGDANGSARASHVPPDASETHWTVEPVDGTPYIQFRNRETDRFLLVGRPLPVLADNIPPEQDNESHWQVIGINTGIAALASPPPDPAYESALASCRDVGGYWTGSSCRRPSYAREPLACPRGFVWADDIGECVWNEAGRCPPWQRGPGGSCGSNLACHGGSARLSGRGHRACYCALGAVAWGRYPNLSCVPSVARIAPLLVPLAVGGATVAILGSRPGRRTIGSVFGNRKFGRGQIGANTPVGFKTISLRGSGTTTTTKPVGNNSTVTTVNPATQSQGTAPTTALTPSQKTVSDFQKLTPEAKASVLNSCKGDTRPGCVAINAAASGTSTANKPNPVTNPATGITTAKPSTGTPPNATATATQGNAGLEKAVSDYQKMTPENQGKVLAACKSNTGPGCAAIIKASAGGTSTTNNPTPVTNPATGITTAKPSTGTPPNATATATQGNAGLEKAVSDYQKMTPENQGKALAACKGNTGPGCAAIIKASAGGTSTDNKPNLGTNPATGTTTAKSTTGTPDSKGTQGTVVTPPNKPAGVQTNTSTDNKKLPPPQTKKETVAVSKPIPPPKQTTVVKPVTVKRTTAPVRPAVRPAPAPKRKLLPGERNS